MLKSLDIISELRCFDEEENIKLKSIRLSESAYAEAQEAFPIVTLDILLYDKVDGGRVFLAKRNAKPLKGKRWFIGGRIHKGENLKIAAERIFKRETKQVLDSSRLEYIFLARYFLKDREQEPQNVGSDSLSFTFGLQLMDGEMQKISENLDPKEYEENLGLKEFKINELLQGEVPIPVIEASEKILL